MSWLALLFIAPTSVGLGVGLVKGWGEAKHETLSERPPLSNVAGNAVAYAYFGYLVAVGLAEVIGIGWVVAHFL